MLPPQVGLVLYLIGTIDGKNNMRILYLSQERNIDLAKKNEVLYLDFNTKGENGQFPRETYEMIVAFDPEVLLEREFNDGKSKYPEIVNFVKEKVPACKRAVWLIDSHCNLEWHLAYAPLFDYVFVAISRYQPIIAGHLNKIGSKTKTFWLPLCYPFNVSKIKRNKSRVPFDIVFVGRWGKWFGQRTDLIDKLQKKYGNQFFAITDYMNMEEYLRQGVISFNCSLADDMNFRVFETLANGVELVTNDVPDLHLIKGLEGRINIYHSEEELYKLCDEILAGKRENDVIKSQIWVANHHSLVHRHREILKMIKTEEQVKY